MLRAFDDWEGEARDGVSGAVRFWGGVLSDFVRSMPREWSAERRRRKENPKRNPPAPSYSVAVLAGLAVFTLYILTLAPTIGFWDAAEYITVAHILGIPHPPGSPLYVLLSRAWDALLAPLGFPVAVRINLFSAALSAVAHGLWFLVIERALVGWTEDRALRRLGAAAAVTISATAFTVWNQSNVNEKVYAVSLLTTALASWLILRWRDTGYRAKTLLLIIFLVALSATNHLMGILVVPALLVFILMVNRQRLFRPAFWCAAVTLVAVGLSVLFFLPIRGTHQPLISEGEPVCESAAGATLSVYTWGQAGCDALSATLTREQYGKPSILSDPTDPGSPRGGELLAAQFANYAQYFNWQWARSVSGHDPHLGGLRLALSFGFVLLGLVGFRVHWQADRTGAAYLGTLLLTLSVGLILYLNFRYGYTIARERFPASEMHEVRERDYFFLLGFSVWGLWAGMGVTALWREAAAALRRRVSHPRLVAAPLLGVTLLPLMLNWGWASRADDYTARDWAYNLLMSVEPYGVLFTNGDNDTFPLWYLQEVEGIRKDVTVVVTTYLNTPWYVKQLRELTTPCPPAADPDLDRTRIICQRPFDPGGLPPALVDAGWLRRAESPRDSIIPLSDEEIDRIATEYLITPQPLVLRGGSIEARIEPGTVLAPADIFAASMLRTTLGDRPIHLMPGSPLASTLGLYDHTVRQGLVWKIPDEGTSAGESDDLLTFPHDVLPSFAGAAIDLTLTDTLVWEVYLRRGRILNPDKPWVDDAVNILMQYAFTHYAAAQAHAIRGAEEAATRHVDRAHWWEDVVDG